MIDSSPSIHRHYTNVTNKIIFIQLNIQAHIFHETPQNFEDHETVP